MTGLTPLAEAQRFVLDACLPLHPVATPLDQVLGCVTSIALTADEAVPPFAGSAMDGFAVRAADTAGATDDDPVGLQVVATLAAGASPEGVVVGPGEAVRIMTGAAVPEGADAVVMVERTSPGPDGGVVLVHAEVPVGEAVRAAGDDLAAGAEVFPAFTTLGPAAIGVLASLGFRRVPVFPRPKVGVLSTGDELVDGPAPLGPGQIRDSNRPALLALVRRDGFEPVDLGVARDEPDALRAALLDAVGRCDAVLTSGGVSVGDFDFVKQVLDDLGGGSFRWLQIAIKPAKPFAFGTIPVAGKERPVPVFGLPGNPVSSSVSYELLARPGIRALMGHRAVHRRPLLAVADDELRRRPDGKVHFARVVAAPGDDGRFHVRSAGGQASHHLAALARANALAILPDGDGVASGADVEILRLS